MTTYNTPPVSWFFGRGTITRSNNRESPSAAKDDDDSSEHGPPPPAQHDDTLAGCASASPSWGMVSDHDDDQDDDTDLDGFNFVAVSTSLLMADRSVEHAASSSSSFGRGGGEEQDHDAKSTNKSSSLDHLVLENHLRGTAADAGVDVDINISDGHIDADRMSRILSEEERCEDTAFAPRAGHTNSTSSVHTHGNASDASVLTIPGTDSLPSDVGTIGDGEELLLFGEQGHGDDWGGASDDLEPREQPTARRRPPQMPLVHCFLKNLHNPQSFRRFRKVSDATDDEHEDPCGMNLLSSGVSVVDDDCGGGTDPTDASVCSAPAKMSANDARLWWWRSHSPRKQKFLLLLLVLAVVSAASWPVVNRQRALREAWEERLRLERDQTAKIYAESERLRSEMQILLEEAAMANAKAESLVREQERLLSERMVLERAAALAESERLRLLDQERAKRDTNQQQRSRRRPTDSGRGGGERSGGGWFFGGDDDDDEHEGCSGANSDDPNSYTLADNCWFKAKASIDFGSCGDETKDYFKDIWNGLWEENIGFGFYGFGSTSAHDGSAGAVEPYSTSREEEGKRRPGDNGEYYGREDYYYQATDDTYYPPQDPLKDLYSVLHSAGWSFVTKLTSLVADETATEVDSLSSSSEAVAFRGEWSKEEYKDVLSTLRAVALNNNRNDNHSDEEGRAGTTDSLPATQQVTRKGLLDAAAALASLSKASRESAESQQTTVEANDGAGEQ